WRATIDRRASAVAGAPWASTSSMGSISSMPIQSPEGPRSWTRPLGQATASGEGIDVLGAAQAGDVVHELVGDGAQTAGRAAPVECWPGWPGATESGPSR